MAILSKQEAEIPLNGGMDTKQGAELQSMASLREVTDLRWNKTGELEKRPNTASTVAVASPGGQGVYAGLGAAGVVESRGEVYALTDEYGAMNESGAYAGGGGGHISIAPVPDPVTLPPKSCRVSRLYVDQCSGNDNEQGFQAYASAVSDGVLVTAGLVRITSGSGCTLSLRAVDIETGSIVAQSQYDNDVGGATTWAVDACENTSVSAPGVIVSFASGAAAPYTVRIYRYLAATKEFVRDADIGTTATSVRHRIKTSPTAGDFLCALNAAGGLFVGQYTAGTLTTSVATHVGVHAADAFDLVISGSKVLIVSALNSATAIYAERFGTPAAYITVETMVAAEVVQSITAARETVSGNADRAQIFWTTLISPGFQPYYRIRGAMANFSATTVAAVGAVNTLLTNAVANAWAVTHAGRAYLLTSGGPNVEPLSAMWVRAMLLTTGSVTQARPVARVMHDVLADLTRGFAGSNLMSACVVGDKIHATLPANLAPDTMPNGSLMFAQSVALSTVDLTPRPLTYAQKDGVSTVASGVAFDLDGNLCSLSQPYCRPVVVVDTSVAGGSTAAAGSGYSIFAVYRWVDAAGREHRSAPSAVVTTGLFVTQSIDVSVAEMPHHCNVPYSIDIYISEDGGTSYYLANTAAGDKRTSFAQSGYRLFTDVLAGVATNPPLYSTGDGDDELVSEPPPSFLAICTVGDRMFAIDAEDRSRVWFTKPFAAGYAPEWNTANTLTIGDQGVGISDVGGVPTVFAERGIWQVYGEGPNALGVGSFAPARRLPHEVECLDGLSVCKTGAGVFFRGRRGVYLLDAGLALQPVGLSIDPNLAASGTPTGYCRIVYDELSNEVHVMDFDSTKHYVFNLLENKWSAWTQNNLQYWRDAVPVRGRMYVHHYAAAGDSIKRVRAIDEAERNHHAYGWTLQTPWLRFDGATGEHRVWEIVVQLRVTGAHPSLARTGGDIAVKYDVRDLPDTTPGAFEWSDAQVYELSGGEDDRTVNLRCQITSQRARQFRFRITEASALYGGPGAVPIAARLIYGVTPSAGRKTSTGQNKGSFVAS